MVEWTESHWVKVQAKNESDAIEKAGQGEYITHDSDIPDCINAT